LVGAGIVIAAPRSGSGKTTVTLGLLRALARRGLRAVGAKCGPDYIDPAFHAAACGRASCNLDSWAMPSSLLRSLVEQVASSADIVVCEGVMGLFDGVPAKAGHSGSTADIASISGWPIVLVHDVSGQSTTAAAIIKGCADYDPRICIGGVLLNRVGSDRHARLASAAIEALGIPVLGGLPRSDKANLPERHLGLVQAAETRGLDALLDVVADFVETHVDIERTLALAGVITSAPPVRTCAPSQVQCDEPTVDMAIGSGTIEPYPAAIAPPGQRIGLARDEAFSFIYPHVVRGWLDAGAEILPFSPLADQPPRPDCDVCWLPGGYPELHAGRIAAASNFLNGLRRFSATRPVHGECGGYMVLGQSLIDASGHRHPMAGLLSIVTSFAQRKLQLGYRKVRLQARGVLGSAGDRLKGHEFHYSTILEPGTDESFALVSDAYGGAPRPAGGRRGLVTGSFFHAIAREI
jgi:cobyrinic acid a,c-diamide synthase